MAALILAAASEEEGAREWRVEEGGASGMSEGAEEKAVEKAVEGEERVWRVSWRRDRG